MITRHFIDIISGSNKRRVHYRMAGKGPPLLMVHQSPRSSKEYEALMKKWSAHFTCIAADTPGFGQSDPLPGKPEISEYADAVIEFLDSLGIEKCAAYGFHSGGIILVTAVKRHASRITTLAVGGYAIWSEDEIQLFGEKYLPEFHPSAYGEHLTLLWNRILEQSWFFPWFAADDEHRLSVANDNTIRIDAAVREMLDAGNDYQAGYSAILSASRDIPAVDAVAPPCLITAYDGDPLQPHIDRLGDMPPNWSSQKVKTPDEQLALSLAHLMETDTPLADEFREADDGGFCVIETSLFDGLVHWRGTRGADYMILHAPGRDCAQKLEQGMLGIDLPGHGLSDDWTDDAPTDWPSWQAVIDAVAAELGIKNFRHDDIPTGNPDLLYPELTPDRFGSYLNTAWQIVRARTVFDPWYLADADHAIPFESDQLEPHILAKHHLALLNARAAKAYHVALESRP